MCATAVIRSIDEATEEQAMWYFTWILGLGAALAFGIINVMWLEASYAHGELDESRIRDRWATPPKDGGE
jgi:cytochrome bd-I ubiquinol oxidase subunit X